MPDLNIPQLNIPPNVSDEEKAKAYSDYFGLPLVRLKGKTVPLDVLNKIPWEVASAFDILAYQFDQSKTPSLLRIVVGNPARLRSKAPAILSELKRQKNINIELAITPRADFDFLLNDYKKKIRESREQTGEKKPTYASIDLKTKIIPYEVLTKFPEEAATRYKMVVFEAPTATRIKVATLDPEDPQIKQILNFVKERNKVEIEVYQTSPQSLDWALRGYRNLPPSPAPISESVPKITLAKPPVTITKPEEAEERPILARFYEIKEEPKPLPLEKIKPKKEEEEKEKGRKQEETPEIKIEEVKSAELTQGIGARESRIALEPSEEEELEKNLDRLLPQTVRTVDDLERVIKAGFIPRTVAAIIYLAVMEEASDIHIEADGKGLRLRYRIDGLLRDILKIPLQLQAPIVSRIKILAKLKIDEQRIPQDGRFEVIVKKREIDLRVSTLPTVRGEKVAMRILDKSSRAIDIKSLGISDKALKIVEDNIRKPYGIILATGPTGSGKTTTLYAIINKINQPEVNIVTLEDPVEYEIPGINQCQIKPKIGFGFAEGLRSILRQDPNIIMVGEIRDQETAIMATHAALTGHLVLSTLHTNDAPTALPRLINMGIEPFLITSAINCIIAQRLVRRICLSCKEELILPEVVKVKIKEEIAKSQNPELSVYKDKELKFYHGRGCANCNDGYRSRIGIFEILFISDKIEELAISHTPAIVIAEEAIKEGMLTMREDGIIKALQGITTIDEVMRVTSQ